MKIYDVAMSNLANFDLANFERMFLGETVDGLYKKIKRFEKNKKADR